MFRHSNPNYMSKRDQYSSFEKRLYSHNEQKNPRLNLLLFTKNTILFPKYLLKPPVMLAQAPRRDPRDVCLTTIISLSVLFHFFLSICLSLVCVCVCVSFQK